MTLTVAEALNPNKPNLDMTLTVAEALNPNKPNLDMILAVAEALNPNKPNLTNSDKLKHYPEKHSVMKVLAYQLNLWHLLYECYSTYRRIYTGSPTVCVWGGGG